MTDHLDSLPAAPITAAPPPEPDEITVGGVTLSVSLFRILVDEAGQHLATLATGLEAMQFDRQLPSAEMVRASHTLRGIHRTGGFPLVANTANALEQCLLALQQQDAPLPAAALPVVARAIESLTDLVARVKSRSAFTDYDQAEALQVQRSLEALPPANDRQASAYRRRGPCARRKRRATSRHRHPNPMLRSAVPAAEPVARRSSDEQHVALVPAPSQVRFDLGVRDDVDDQVLPIFLEEAAELFPAGGRRAACHGDGIRSIASTRNNCGGRCTRSRAVRE